LLNIPKSNTRDCWNFQPDWHQQTVLIARAALHQSTTCRLWMVIRSNSEPIFLVFRLERKQCGSGEREEGPWREVGERAGRVFSSPKPWHGSL
jgi:hypothetical protein